MGGSFRTVVPGVDSTANETTRDVVGNKLDTHDGNSVCGVLHSLNDHAHGAGNVYPTLANGVAVAGAAGVWTLGAFVEIVPINTITAQFDIHYISVEALDDNTFYEIVLYAVEVEIGRVHVTKNANQDGTTNAPFMCGVQPANTQIQAKCASAAGNSVATIGIFYHIY